MSRTLWKLSRMALNGGSANWRLRSGRRLTDRIPSEECTSKANANLRTLASRLCSAYSNRATFRLI